MLPKVLASGQLWPETVGHVPCPLERCRVVSLLCGRVLSTLCNTKAGFCFVPSLWGPFCLRPQPHLLPQGAGHSYCWEPHFVVPWQVTGTFREQPQEGLGENESAVQGGVGVGWRQLHWSSVLQGSSGYLWFCLRRKKIYEDKNLKADFFPVTEKLI